MELLDESRPLTNEEIDQLKKSIPRPADIDETLFNSVVDSVVDGRSSEIQGVESNPVIKEIIRQREIREQERLARINIKLTQEMKDDNNFPSARDEALPKYYKKAEIPAVLAQWTKTLTVEVYDVLGLNDNKAVNSEPMKIGPKAIESIVSGLSYQANFKGDIPEVQMNSAIADRTTEQVRQTLRRQLQKAKPIKPERIGRLTQVIQERFERSLCLPGKLVGNVMAAAYGEAATQQTLNTFHASGDRNARKTVTGFAKFNSILEATENTESSGLTIFMKGRLTNEQMRLQISNIQSTTLSDLILGHRVFSSAEPMPRWEYVADITRGINYNFIYDKRLDRFNLHRRHRDFATDAATGITLGRILEIKLNVKEMFFRRISMSKVASAIEQLSTNYRVVTSTLAIGLIYVYFNFQSLSATKSLTGVGVNTAKDAEIPDFATADIRRFALENMVYTSLRSTRISGIAGVNYALPASFRISPTINFTESTLDPDSVGHRVTLRFNVQKVIMSGIRTRDISDFVQAKVRLMMREIHDIHEIINEDTYEYSFDSSGLRYYNAETKVHEAITMKNLKQQLESDSKILTTAILRRPVETAVTEINAFAGRQIGVAFDAQSLELYGIELQDLATKLAAYLGGDDAPDVVSNVAAVDSIIYLTGLPDSTAEVFVKLNDFMLQSDKLQELSVRWYYSAEGRNLAEVLAHPTVDSKHTRADNLVDCYRTLGVSCTHQIALEEIASNVDSKLHPAHIALLAASLFYRTPNDKPLSQNHHGMVKRGAEWTGRMWETTTDVAMEAGLGQIDHLHSFSAKIMMGTLGRSGKMTKEDRDNVMTDRDVFRFDGQLESVEEKKKIEARADDAKKIIAKNGGKIPVTKARVVKEKPKGKAPKLKNTTAGLRLPPSSSSMPAAQAPFIPESGDI